MVRKRLTHEEEQALAKAAEGRPVGSQEWDFAHARRVDRGRSPTVVLSGRVPVVYAQMLRRKAIAERRSISDLVKEALESYAVATLGYSYTPKIMEIRTSTAAGAETMNGQAELFMSDEPTGSGSETAA